MNTTLALDGSTALTHLGVIRARGADANTFLQGQLTNDMLSLDLGQARLAGFCSAKGRLQASFIVWRAADDELILVCSASLLPSTLKRLSMFVMRAKCVLSDASAELQLIGHVGGSAQVAIGHAAVWEQRLVDGVSTVRLPDAQGLARCLVAAPVGMPTPPPSGLSLDNWRWLEVRSGLPTI